MEKNAIDSPVLEATVPTPSIPQKLWTPLTISLTVLVVFIVFGIVFFDTIVNQPMIKSFLAGSKYQPNKLERSNILPTSTPSPTPTRAPKPIPNGKQTFSVSSGKITGPQFQTGAIDPYDPQKGSQQIISISIESSLPVTIASLTMETDTKSKEISMQLTSGTTNKGIWAASWTVDDTYLYTYNAIIQATDGQETNTITITLR